MEIPIKIAKHYGFCIAMFCMTIGTTAQEYVSYANFGNTSVSSNDSIFTIASFGRSFSGTNFNDSIIVSTENILPFFSGNGSTATKDIREIKGLNMFPNPVAEMLILTRDVSDETLNVQFYDVNGKLLTHRSWTQGEQMQISVHSLPGGIYFVTVTNTDVTRGGQFKVVKR